MKKLASSFIDLTHDACRKVYWRRDALKTFLRQHGISEGHISTWNRDETKRIYLTRLFYDLVNSRENRDNVILGIAIALSDMEHFPDLENWEDSKEKIVSAKEAVSRLKVEVDKIKAVKIDEEAKKQRRLEAEKRKEEALAVKQTTQTLNNALLSMTNQQGTAEGGYKFQKWFYDLCVFFDIESRPGFTSDGRQIDGALTIDGTTFLIETKFSKNPIGSQDIDIFMSKVTSKSDNTMGIFVSMSGYTDGAIKTASRERTPILLLDYTHIFNLILPSIMTLQDVIRRVKRHSSQMGQAHLAVNNFSQ